MIVVLTVIIYFFMFLTLLGVVMTALESRILQPMVIVQGVEKLNTCLQETRSGTQDSAGTDVNVTVLWNL